ncbi:hypothetical protein [Pseudoclavibacter helvolus]|uniref:hypothetical protein n=1 Tax=Pseudoclavibacter helvolus TaxID=255205 RepID=UPI003C76A908
MADDEGTEPEDSLDDEAETDDDSAPSFSGFKLDPAVTGFTVNPAIAAWSAAMQPTFDKMAANMAEIAGLATARINPALIGIALPRINLVNSYFENNVATVAIAAAMREISRPLDKLLVEIGETISDALRLAPDPGVINRGMLPPTLRGFADEFDAREVFELVGAEGVPIWSVPRPRIARLLAKAPDPSTRRQLLNHHYDAILADCREAIAEVPPSEEWSGLLRFADRALASAQAGHFEAGQALLTSTLDTAVTKIVPKHAKGDVISGGQKPEHRHRYFKQMGPQAAYAWVPAWHAYVNFDARRDADIPRTFSRNATSHAVHRYQYSKRNTAWAALVVTNLLIALTRGLVDKDGLIEAAKEAKEKSGDQPR